MIPGHANLSECTDQTHSDQGTAILCSCHLLVLQAVLRLDGRSALCFTASEIKMSLGFDYREYTHSS